VIGIISAGVPAAACRASADQREQAMVLTTIPACEGAAVRLARGQILRLVDPLGGQSGEVLSLFGIFDIQKGLES